MDALEDCLDWDPLSVEAMVGKGLVSGVDTMAGSNGVGIYGWKLSAGRIESMPLL
jgi:hypothetical protein